MCDRLVVTSNFHGVRKQPIRDLPVHTPSIIRVRKGYKTLRWKNTELTLDPSNWLLVSGHQRLTFTNYPQQSGFASLQMAFYVPPPKKLCEQPPITQPSPAITPDASLRHAFDIVQSMHNHSPAAQHCYLEAFYHQLHQAGALCLLFPHGNQTLRDRVVNFLQTNPAHNHSVQLLSTHLHISKSTLNRQLAQENTSFRQLLIEVRMTHALELLQHNQPVPQVAQGCGYASSMRFSQGFKKQFGLTPRQYKRTLG